MVNMIIFAWNAGLNSSRAGSMRVSIMPVKSRTGSVYHIQGNNRLATSATGRRTAPRPSRRRSSIAIEVITTLTHTMWTVWALGTTQSATQELRWMKSPRVDWVSQSDNSCITAAACLSLALTRAMRGSIEAGRAKNSDRIRSAPRGGCEARRNPGGTPCHDPELVARPSGQPDPAGGSALASSSKVRRHVLSAATG